MAVGGGFPHHDVDDHAILALADPPGDEAGLLPDPGVYVRIGGDEVVDAEPPTNRRVVISMAWVMVMTFYGSRECFAVEAAGGVVARQMTYPPETSMD
jgi:hypothetical protein